MNSSVMLRDVIEADLPVFFDHQSDPAASEMADFPSRERQAFTAHWSKILGDPSNILKTILYDGHVAGNIVSWEQSGEREVGYWLGREYWGRGIATQALSQFLDQVRIRPLYAHVARNNVASLRVLQKCGFTLYGEAGDISNAGGEGVEELILKLDAAQKI